MALLGLDNQFSGALNAGYSSGLAKGMLAAKEDNREERKLGMAEEEFGWKRDAVEKEKLLQTGMAQAAQSGGYEGVIAFLQKNDPERAINFTSAKEKLDAQIMDNDVMRNIKIPSMQQDALLESYSKLGKMGAAILQAPEDQRDAVYQAMLPIAKVINPNMPDNLQQAAPMLLLAAAQATPTNQLFKYGQQALTHESDIGKADADYRSRKAAGVPDSDPAMVALRSKIDASSMASAEARAKLALTENGQISQQQAQEARINQATNNWTRQIQQGTKEEMKFYDTWVTANGALRELQVDPNNPMAQKHFGYQFARILNGGGTMTQTDVDQRFSAYGLPQLSKKVWSLANGEVADLLPQEVDAIKHEMLSVKDQKIQSLRAKEAVYQSTASNDPLVNWSAVTLPSKMYEQYENSQKEVDSVIRGQVPPELQAAAERAVASGQYTKEQADVVVRREMLNIANKAQAEQAKNNSIRPGDYAPTPDNEAQVVNQIMQNQKQIIRNDQELNG
jgi:hypothetical protein